MIKYKGKENIVVDRTVTIEQGTIYDFNSDAESGS